MKSAKSVKGEYGLLLQFKSLGKIILITTICLLLAGFIIAGNDASATGSTEKYPDVYTLDSARDLMESGQRALSLWYCINLYPEQPDEVVSLVCNQRDSSDDLVGAVRSSFAANAPFDPAVSITGEGIMIVDAKVFARKGAWADSLCGDIERELIEKFFVNDLTDLFAEEYVEATAPQPSDHVLGILEWMRLSDDVSLHIHRLKGREGREVRDYEGKLFGRINVVVMSGRDSVICDSVWNSVLRTMELRPPLREKLPDGVKSPPKILVRGIRSIVIIDFRCEDLLTRDGMQDNSAFFEQAELIAGMIKGCRPAKVLACACGGPLRSLSVTRGK
jgi:hypothetical protein